MVKKMWAIFKDKKIKEVNSVNKRCNLRNLKDNETCGVVWVTDKDPFENVRKELDFLRLENKNPLYGEETKIKHLKNFVYAMEKIVKNFDEGAE